MPRRMLLRNGFRWALTVSFLLACQAPAWAGCNNLFGLCHLGCYKKKRCCQVPCPTVCNEACFGYFPTQWQVWPCPNGSCVTPTLVAPPAGPEPLPAPKVEGEAMPPISMR